jgi:4-amino-4-deoxy-L-arabinose transferase-like glycosyltransferase
MRAQRGLRPVLRGTIARVRAVPAPLKALLVAALFISVGWSLAIAPLQGFDEADHVAYAVHVAENGSAPGTADSGPTYTPAEDGALAGLGYLRILGLPEAKPPWQQLQERSFRAYEQSLPTDSQSQRRGPNPLAKNPPLYYAYEAIPYHLSPWTSFLDRAQAMRWGSTLLFLVAICCMWALAGEVFRSRLARTVATAVFALQPVVGYMSGIVNTDIQLMLVWTAFFWLALRTLRLGPSPARLAVLGLVSAASILTHGRGLAIAPAFVIALVAILAHHRPPLRRGLLSVASGLGVVLVALGVYRLVASGGALYGGEVNIGASAPGRSMSAREFLGFVWQFYFPRLDSMTPRLGPAYGFRDVFVLTYFGSFASYDVLLPDWVRDLVQLGLVGGAGTLLYLAISRFRSLIVPRGAQLVVLVGGGAMMLGLLHFASYRALVGGSNDPLITGRYLLPLTALLALGAGTLTAAWPRRAGPVLGGVLAAGMAAMTVGGIAAAITRFYV